MIKNLVIFTLILLGIGTAFSIYLPEHNPQPEGTTTPSAEPRISLITESLEKPIDAESIRPSTRLFDETTEPASYAIQLGFFYQLEEAFAYGKQINNTIMSINKVPQWVIFKAVEAQREWYIMALGPIEHKADQQYYQNILQENGIKNNTIIWPASLEAEKASN